MGAFRKLLLLGLIISPIAVLGYLGFIPGIASFLGSDTPRDLGTAFTTADHTSARTKSQMEYETLPPGSTAPGGWQTSGSRSISTEFTSAEVTALMNNRPWKYYPYKNVQVKFNADGSAEVSGVLIRERVPAYGESFGAPKEAIDFINKFFPAETVFYVKGRAALTDNELSLFEPQRFEIGRLPMPLGAILAALPPQLVKEAHAVDTAGMLAELSKLSGKRALIVEFINSRLANIQGFSAKSARFAEGKLIFDGTLPEKESTLR